MAGRIETYTHSDKLTENKGGAIVQVLCQTDFGARTKEFIAFAKEVAKMAYASIDFAKSINDIYLAFPDLKEKQEAVEKELSEKITIQNFHCLRVDFESIEPILLNAHPPDVLGKDVTTGAVPCSSSEGDVCEN